MPADAADFLGMIENVSPAVFHDLPAHPVQRDTRLHGAALAASGVLARPLPAHANVAAVLMPNGADITLSSMRAAWKKNPVETLHRYGRKLDGHTRDLLWHQGSAPVPPTLRISVYAAADLDGATALYKAFDSAASTKGIKDETQSTFAAAGFHPTSSLVRRATGFKAALDLADAALTGGLGVKVDRRSIATAGALDPENVPQPATLEALLPYLPRVRRFLPALAALDALDLNGKLAPVLPGFLAGYLLILDRDPQRGAEFLRLLRGNPGQLLDGQMDAVFAIQRIRQHIDDPARRTQQTSAQRTGAMLACTLNAYTDWLDGKDRYPPKGFPTANRIISTFNPEPKPKEVALRRGRQATGQPSALA